MDTPGSDQTQVLKQFFIRLATDPELQIKLADVHKNAYYEFLLKIGLPQEAAQLLADAYASQEGREKLCKKLPEWTCVSHNAVVAQEE